MVPMAKLEFDSGEVWLQSLSPEQPPYKAVCALRNKKMEGLHLCLCSTPCRVHGGPRLLGPMH